MNLHRLARPRKAPRTKPRNPDRVYCPPHLSWLRKRNCCVQDGDFGPGAIGCSGKMEAHHVKTRGAGGGDDSGVPLCVRHHGQYHTVGHDTFERMYAVDLERIAAELWRLSPHRMKWQRDNED